MSAESLDPRETPNGHDEGSNDVSPSKPLIGVTMGDPAGIGAEVIVKALADPEIRALGRFIVYGLDEFMLYAADLAEINPYWFKTPRGADRRVSSGVLVVDFDELPPCAPGVHKADASGGRASLGFLDEAIEDARRGTLDALVTAPIHKVSWKLAGCRYPGHTEKLAAAFQTERVTMMFAAEDLRVALATVHLGLFEVRHQFTIGCVFRAIDQLGEALKTWWGIEAPRMAVAGLNPHAGEEGRFGDEENRVIEPAIRMARDAGWDARGPFPADTLFVERVRRKYHGIVAMYHDQGLIPVKMLAFDSAVNLTLGLPLVRASVDHGTAFDIAGRNQADPGSMKHALRLACRFATAPHPPSLPRATKRR